MCQAGSDALAYFAALAQTDTGDMHRFGDAIAYSERAPLGMRRHWRMELSGANRLLESRSGTGRGKRFHSQTFGDDTTFGKPYC